MTALQVLQGIASYAVLALMLYLLVRAPRNVPLRAVTVVIACWALAYALGRAASDGAVVLGIEPIMSRLIQHMLLLVGAYSLICFYLFSALNRGSARRRAAWQAVPLAAAVVIMTIATATIPADLRNAAAALPSGKDGPVSQTGVALLYLTVNLYMVYAFATTLFWTRRYARGAEPRLRRGLLLASIGLAAIVVALAVFVTSNITRWAGSTLPSPVVTAGILVILPGIVVFLIGFSYPAAVMRIAALRVWWQHRRKYHHLAPLWTVLHAEFPEDALSRVPVKPWRDVLSLRGVHRRYYRRVIECRDGLVRISPYLGPHTGRDGADAATLARQLTDGLRARAAGKTVPPRATPVAIPAADGLDADVEELVALSQALQANPRAGVS